MLCPTIWSDLLNHIKGDRREVRLLVATKRVKTKEFMTYYDIMLRTVIIVFLTERRVRAKGCVGNLRPVLKCPSPFDTDPHCCDP